MKNNMLLSINKDVKKTLKNDKHGVINPKI